MKTITISLLGTIFIYFVLNFHSTKAQDKFPIGLYSANSANTAATSTDSNYYNLMKELGANWLIIQPHSDTKNRYNADTMKIISMDLDSVNNMPNYIYYYTGGYYKKWFARDAIDPSNGTGLKKQNGVGEMEDTLWVSKSTQTTGVLLNGPNYRQDKKYRAWVGDLGGRSILYNIIIRYKVDTMDVPPATTQNVCKITLQYKYIKNGANTYNIDTAYITTYDATGEFKLKTINYNLEYFINKYGDASQRLIENTTVSEFDDNAPGQGLNIKFEYLGESKLYIDYIEIYDNTIGLEIRENPSEVDSNISAYVSAMSNRLPSTLKYWYSLDEPQTIDNYYPYNFVNDILKVSLNDNPIITTHYPTWSGQRNGDQSIQKFIQGVNPDQFMYYYYPIFPKNWGDVDSIDGSIFELDTMRARLQQAHISSPDFWYTVQAHGFYYNWNWDKRTPHPNELSAQVMLSLAHGAKGIFYYNLFSYGNDSTKHYSLLDSTYSRTDRFLRIRDSLKPRIEGDFGKTLLGLDYTGDYIRKGKRQTGSTFSYSPLDSYLSIADITTSSPPYNYHVGLMEDSSYTDQQYFLITNLICPPGSNRTARLTINDNYDFTNIGIKNIGETYNNSFNGSSSYQFDFTIPPGDGYLFQLAPVLKYGGNLVYDDTVKTAITLIEQMTIKPNAGLVIETLYTVDSGIYVEDGGNIDVKWYYGNIDITSNGSIEFEDWSDCLIGAKTSDLHHPRLIFNENDSPYLQYYNIYKKHGSSAWALLDTTSSTSYTDLTTTIAQPGGQAGVDVKYKVAALIIFKQTIEEYTNEVIYPTPGQEIEKKGSENNNVAKPTTFALEQNHPNPFNPTTVITYQVPTQSKVTIKVYDILGSEIIELVNSTKEAGIYNVTFDASNLSSGTYIYRMEAGKYVESRKMIILK